MKQLLKLIIPSLLLFTMALSCKKDEHQVVYEGGTNPVLTATSTTPMVLLIGNRNNFAIRFNWTNPEYRFNTGISSQDVTYTLQIDTTGSNFTNPKKYEKVISKDLSVSFTVGELNSALLAMDLLENIPHNVEFRIKSSLANGSVPLYSNVLKIIITPYLDVLYPVPAKLYITGAATPGNWMGGGDPELVSQRFTQISSTEFQIASLPINPNAGFLFVPVYGNWSNKYGYPGAGLTNNVYGDDFIPGGNDFKSPPLAGNYKINVNFKTGKYTFTKL